MEPTVISIPIGDNNSPKQKTGKQSPLLSNILAFLQGKNNCKYRMRKAIHSGKVGIALVLVSLLYLLDPLFKQVGQNAMWAIMTVVVIFEFYAGATLSKGINRGIGTIFGGGLGCLAAIFADKFGGIGNAIVVGTSVFLIGAAATYCRLVPSIKRRHDYGAMIFILTFNLVAVSGLRADKVMSLAGERLSTIGMGFAVCLLTSLLVFPMWASDELHHSTASKFEKMASCIEESLEEYFRIPDKDGNQPSATVLKGCKSVLHSKSNDESLANFARWEPWHGKFGFNYPWEKYLEIGEILRELSSIVLSLHVCIQSPSQPAPNVRPIIKEACEIIGLSLAWILRELGESILKMKSCQTKTLIAPKLKSVKSELSKVKSTMQANGFEQDEHFAAISLVFLLTEIAEKVEIVGEEVEKLGELACFQSKNSSV